MKKIAFILGSIAFCGMISTTAQAENELKPVMKTMGQSFSAANKAENNDALKKELSALRDRAAQAQKHIPDHLKAEPADSAKRKLFAEGITKLLGEIDATLALSNAGKFEEAKAGLAKIKAVQGEYHKQLKP